MCICCDYTYTQEKAKGICYHQESIIGSVKGPALKRKRGKRKRRRRNRRRMRRKRRRKRTTTIKTKTMMMKTTEKHN